MAFRKLVGSYKDYTLSTHIIEAGYLAVDVDTGSLRIGDGVTAGGTEVGGGGASSLGDLNAVGSTLSAPSNADMTLQTSGTGIVLINDTFKIGSGASVTTILDEDHLVFKFGHSTGDTTINKSICRFAGSCQPSR